MGCEASKNLEAQELERAKKGAAPGYRIEEQRPMCQTCRLCCKAGSLGVAGLCSCLYTGFQACGSCANCTIKVCGGEKR